MIIHQPEIIQQADHTIVWAKIELAKKQENFPDLLWYRLPTQYAEYISLNSDAFLAPALIAAMNFGEDVQVRGTVSPRLAYHLHEYQFLLNFWMPQAVLPVSLQFDRLAPVQAQPQAVGCTFSGGVDSWFSIWKHLPQNQPVPEYRLTHALFINRFDLLSKNAHQYHWLFDHYHSELQQLNIDLIPMETNLVRLIIPRLRYVYFFSPILAGCTMLLQALFKTFYIASSRYHRELMKRRSSSDPLTERLLSTDTLDFIHFGAMYQRFEKIEIMRDWQPVQKNLRVCAMPDLGEREFNCSRCEKCTRTMIPIYALGKMDKFSTFTKPFRKNRDTLLWARKFTPDQISLPELFRFVKRNKPGLLPWLRCAVLLGSLRNSLMKRIPNRVKPWLQRYGFYLDALKEENAFDDPQIIRSIRKKARLEPSDWTNHNDHPPA